MRFLELLDTWIIDKIFQRLSDWFTNLTGRSNFFFAKICIYAFVIVGIAGISWSGEDLMSKALRSIVVALLMFWSIQGMEKLDKRSERDASMRVMSPLRPFVPFGFMRIVILFVVVWFALPRDFMRAIGEISLSREALESIAHAIGDVLIVLFLYLEACSPKPPSRLHAGNPIAAATVKT